MDLFGTAALIKPVIDSVRSAVGLAKETQDLVGSFDQASDLEVKRGELVDKLVELQLRLLTLQSSVYDIREEIEEYDRFKERADRYQLRKTEAGGFVYTLKADAQPPQAVHDICPACYENRKTAVLQPLGRLLVCPTCKTEFPNLPLGDQVMVARTPRPDRYF